MFSDVDVSIIPNLKPKALAVQTMRETIISPV
jgi:hypothetical protein